MNQQCIPIQTSIRIGRRGSSGIEGTFRNAEHHAKPVIPLVKALIALLPDAGFKDWIQYNNVHTLVTQDGREFNCRPLVYEFELGKEDTREPTQYGKTWGLRVSCKVSRTEEIALFDIKDMSDVTKAFQFFKQTNSLKKNLYSNQPRSFLQ